MYDVTKIFRPRRKVLGHDKDSWNSYDTECMVPRLRPWEGKFIANKQQDKDKINEKAEGTACWQGHHG